MVTIHGSQARKKRVPFRVNFYIKCVNQTYSIEKTKYILEGVYISNVIRNPMLDAQKLNALQEVLRPFLPLIAKAADAIVDQDISNYPIFVVYQEEEQAGLGLAVVAGTVENDHWSVNISTLEELATKQVVAMEKVDSFRKIYQSNPNSLCWLVWQNGAAQIVFVPRPEL